MKSLPIFFLTMPIYLSAIAQKPVLEINTLKNWQEVSNGHISNNSNFVSYQTEDSKSKTKETVIIQTKTQKKWRFPNLTNLSFSEKEAAAAGKIGDTLLLLNLINNQITKLPNIDDYSFISTPQKDYVIYRNTQAKNLTIANLESTSIKVYDSVSMFQISPDNKSIILFNKINSKNNRETISHINTNTLNSSLIYLGNPTSRLIFSNNSQQIAFIASNPNGKSIWHYQMGTKYSEELVNAQSTGIDTSLLIDGGDNWRFCPSNNYILFVQYEKERKKTTPSTPEIWNSKDVYLLSHFKGKQYSRYSPFKSIAYLSNVNIKTKVIKKILERGENIDPISFQDKSSPYAIYLFNIRYKASAVDNQAFDFGVCNIETGEKKIISRDNIDMVQNFSFSPDHRYIIYFKSSTGQYYSYNINRSKEVPICSSPGIQLLNKDYTNYLQPTRFPTPIIGWINDASRVILSDSYDLWAFDLEGTKPVINLTNGLGAKDSIVFYPIDDKLNGYYSRNRQYNSRDILYLKAFNVKTKNAGYYSTNIKRPVEIKQLSMDPYTIGRIGYQYDVLGEAQFCRSKSQNGFLIKRESATDAPNYYFSPDLRHFEKLSNIQPQEKYNWLTTELHNFQDSNGNPIQGILFKPENFDSTKKYPLVIAYYDQVSNELNKFPDVTLGTTCLPNIVSQGYLVFEPDIKTYPTNPGAGLINTINSTFDHLKQYSWINTNKVALMGWSLGGWETNYIVTHIDRPISAAISGAGVSDLTTLGFMFTPAGNTKLDFLQYGVIKMGKSLAENHDVYIDHSPLYSAQNIKAPILLIHNPEDQNVEQYQGISFFIQLRNLNKPAWLLSYSGESHSLSNPDNIVDLRKKMIGFLDYYLKGLPEPGWMQQPITNLD